MLFRSHSWVDGAAGGLTLRFRRRPSALAEAQRRQREGRVACKRVLGPTQIMPRANPFGRRCPFYARPPKRGALRRAEHGSASPSRRAQSEPGMGAALAPRSAPAVRPCDRAAVIHNTLFSTGLTWRVRRFAKRSEAKSPARGGWACLE